MIAAIEPLSRLPGVQVAMLISHDGVPIACAGRKDVHVAAADAAATSTEKQEALAALAASWLNELTQAVAPLSWNPPERVCFRAARGTLVVRRAENAVLVVMLSREASPEDVRLSMDGTLARIERSRLGREADSQARANESREELPGPLPSRTGSSDVNGGSRTPSEPADRSHLPGN